jgi:hypothetical protein
VAKAYSNLIHIYRSYVPYRVYAIGIDVAQGQGGDYQAVVILGSDGQTEEVDAIIHCNDVKPTDLAWTIYELAKEYNYPLLGVEANTIGQVLANKLIELEYPNMFYTDIERSRVGWLALGSRSQKVKSKEVCVMDLAVALTEGNVMTYYKPMVLEMASYQRTQDGKMRGIGSNDDLVMGLVIAHQIMMHVAPPTPKKMEKLDLFVNITTGGMYGDN